MENGTAGAEAAEAPKKPKLTRLKIERFRNVEPCELRFGDGFNVLLGLNGSGKTTLLELIAARNPAGRCIGLLLSKGLW